MRAPTIATVEISFKIELRSRCIMTVAGKHRLFNLIKPENTYRCAITKRRNIGRAIGPPARIHFVIAVWSAKEAGFRGVKYWEIIADNRSKAGCSWGCVSVVDFNGRTTWIADAHASKEESLPLARIFYPIFHPHWHGRLPRLKFADVFSETCGCFQPPSKHSVLVTVSCSRRCSSRARRPTGRCHA
jgi:hypothetical protein